MEESKSKQSTKNKNLSGKTHSAFVYSKDGIMSSILDNVEKFAQKQSPILISGETGTGKEYIAKLIHALSDVKGPLVTVNCSAIPSDLLENELFGHEKGAYTGAIETTDGYVGRAKNGIIFLDEIGELPLYGQVKLLRLIQDGEYEKIGSHKAIKTDARFVLATNRNLTEQIKKGLFRADLYYRISTLEIELPPIRDRGSDMDLLIDHFLWIAATRMNAPSLTIHPDCRKILLNYSWPGNVREMQNVILHGAAVCRNNRIETTDLPSSFSLQSDFTSRLNYLKALEEKKETLEKEIIEEALKQSDGNKSRAAEMLGISRSSLRNKISHYGIDKK